MERAVADGMLPVLAAEAAHVVKKRKLDSDISESGTHEFTGDTFEVLVGSKPTRFVLHEALACRVSSFSEKALHGGFSEATTRVVRLVDHEPQIFSYVASYIYRGSFTVDTAHAPYHNLSKLWVLADKLCMPHLQNRVVDSMLARSVSHPNISLSNDGYEYIYKHTLPGSPLRHMVVDITLRSMGPDVFQRFREGLPGEFVGDMCRALIEYLYKKEPRERKPMSPTQSFYVKAATPESPAATTSSQ